ncbi:hypothetical protein EYF80_019551 [Liparis tanakae]|uniref:Uncharacterized protein n=1 Tax=Liparis tanakae TaxID=230148 RepID=A0A4Z2HXB2_9TELE|nr:hypothetical protein EYF80_019551 [Liparis tanakae]
MSSELSVQLFASNPILLEGEQRSFFTAAELTCCGNLLVLTLVGPSAGSPFSTRDEPWKSKEEESCHDEANCSMCGLQRDWKSSGP